MRPNDLIERKTKAREEKKTCEKLRTLARYHPLPDNYESIKLSNNNKYCTSSSSPSTIMLSALVSSIMAVIPDQIAQHSFSSSFIYYLWCHQPRTMRSAKSRVLSPYRKSARHGRATTSQQWTDDNTEPKLKWRRRTTKAIKCIVINYSTSFFLECDIMVLFFLCTVSVNFPSVSPTRRLFSSFCFSCIRWFHALLLYCFSFNMIRGRRKEKQSEKKLNAAKRKI